MSRELTPDELATVCSPVPEGKDVTELLTNMRAVLRSRDGIGLAANQIGYTDRVIIIDIPGGFQSALINPEITKRSRQIFISKEGCLSFPKRLVPISRHKQITIHGFDENWEPIGLKLRGLASACAQHEIDHLDGVTIIDRSESNS